MADERRRTRANNCERRCGWGGRTRTSEWRNQNLPDHIDFGTLFSQPRDKARMSHQKLTSKLPTKILRECEPPASAIPKAGKRAAAGNDACLICPISI